MSITYHRAATDDGGAIGDEIVSGVSAALLPVISAQEQTDGVSIARKLYIKNNGAEAILFSKIAIDNTYATFPAILFKSSGDAQVVGDLTGSETDESPISITIPAGSHASFWVRVDVPSGSTITDEYNTIDIKTIY